MCAEDMIDAQLDAMLQAADEDLARRPRGRKPKVTATGRQVAYLLDLLESKGYPVDVLTPEHWGAGLDFTPQEVFDLVPLRRVVERTSMHKAHRLITSLGG